MNSIGLLKAISSAAAGWFPVLTLILGYLGRARFEELQHRHNMERDREAREAQRKEQRHERRTAFQRQTLLDLHDALMNTGRAAGAAHVHEVMAFRRTGEWGRELLGEDLNENLRLAMRNTSMLMVRVRDDEVRQLTGYFKEAAAGVTNSSEEASYAAFARMETVFQELNERVGQIVRHMDDD